MIRLDSEIWGQLSHAYGSASDIPALLSLLSNDHRDSGPESEPFNSLWSALCHQGDAYSASYAAVPYIVDAALRNPGGISFDFLLLPTAIEISRRSGRGHELPEELASRYLDAIARLPKIVGLLDFSSLDETWAVTAAAAVAVSSGQPKLADAILALEGEIVDEFMEWIENR